MLCRRCGIFGDPVRLKWWHKWLPRARRWYCAGCGRTYLSLFDRGDDQRRPSTIVQ